MEPMNKNMEAAFAQFPEGAREKLLALRARIFAVATREGIAIEEALRWGQPAYLAPKGSTIRLGVPKTGGYAIYTHCQSSLMSDFRSIAPELSFEGNRAVHFGEDQAAPAALDLLIKAALTYHMA